MKSFCLLSFLLYAFPVLAQNQTIPVTGREVPAFAPYENALKTIMQRWSIPGAALAITDGGRLVYSRGLGYADREAGIPVQPASLFRFASLSKTLTGMTIVKLAEEGRLSLDAKFMDLIPNITPIQGVIVDPRIRQITVRQLLQHTGGWDKDVPEDWVLQFGAAYRALNVPYASLTPELMCRYAISQRLDFDPGTRYSYSQTGYLLLGRIIEKITGKKYEDVVREKLLTPAGVTTFKLGHSQLSQREPDEVKYYDYPGAPLATVATVPGVAAPAPRQYASWWIEQAEAYGGWIGNTVDVMKFINALEGRRGPAILNATSLAAIVARPAPPVTPTGAYVGLTWRITPITGGQHWWHSGGATGTRNLMARRQNNRDWVVLMNSRPLDEDTIITEIFNAFADAETKVTSWPTNDLFADFSGPTLATNAQSLAFTHVWGGKPPDAQTLQVTAAPSAVNFTIAQPAAKWLSIDRLTGSTPSALRFSVDPTGLDPGEYQAFVTIAAPQSGNGARSITVTLRVTPPQVYESRIDFGARLEPQGALMHGAGQSYDAFAAYWKLMPAGRQPTVSMHYVNLKGLKPDWADGIRATLRQYPEAFIVPQIGLSMTGSDAASHYEQQVAAGEYDAEIGNLVEGLRRLGLPVYLRIGYEFNGLNWNGYEPASYREAFIRVTTKLRESNLEVATVWDSAIDGGSNFFDYYPGDEYVDWFGINIFSAAHFKNPGVRAFLDGALAHNKPVMVGETTSRGVGAQNGEASWTGWYEPFFEFLRGNREVKQFNYINWDWAYWASQLGSNWGDWGDARLETDAAAYVRDRYIAQLGGAALLHAGSESDFRRRLGYNDSTAPARVERLTAEPAPGGVSLNWTPAEDPSGIARYIILRGDAAVEYTLAPTFLERGAAPGTAAYSVAAMDRAGNLSERSDAVVVTLDSVERMLNGGFESGMENWRIEFFDPQVAASVTADPGEPISGAASARLSVESSSGTNWHAQLRQFFNLTEGRNYTFRFRARSSEPVSLQVVVQQVSAPNTIYLNRSAAMTAETTEFSFSFRAPASQQVAAAYFFGQLGTASVWLDDVSVSEMNP